MQEKINRAGLVPYIINDDGEIEMMFMKPSNPNFGGPDFQIAKGKIDHGETSIEAAVREAVEELGLFKGNINGDVHSVGKFLGRTDVYTCRVNDKDMFGLPHYETGDTTWMTPDQFNSTGRVLHKPVIQAVVRKIKQLEKINE